MQRKCVFRKREPKKWEYSKLDLSPDEEVSILDHMGINGWELVSVVVLGTKIRHYLKREMQIG